MRILYIRFAGLDFQKNVHRNIFIKNEMTNIRNKKATLTVGAIRSCAINIHDLLSITQNVPFLDKLYTMP